MIAAKNRGNKKRFVQKGIAGLQGITAAGVS